MKFKKITLICILTFLFTWMGGVIASADSSLADSTTVLKNETVNQAGQTASQNVSCDAVHSEPERTVTPKLCISTYTQGKSGVWTYDTGNKKWDQIVKDRNVHTGS